MLTCSLSEKIISIDVNLQINNAHTFSIAFFSATSSYTLKSEISIYRDGTEILDGIVTNYSYNALSQVMTISGQDKTSYDCSHDALPNALISQDDKTLTTVSDAINLIKRTLQNEHEETETDIIESCPIIQCYGFGHYNSNTQSFISRICNSFGLNYYANPISLGYKLTPGDITEPTSYTIIPGYTISDSSDINTCISNIFVQKAITSNNRTTLNIKNGSISNTQQVRLINPNSVESGNNAQFPKDYWLEPWQKVFCTIDVPISTISYKEAVSIQPAQKIVYANCTDTLANPAWKLEIWDDNPGVGDIPSATRLGYLSKGQTWTANNSEQYANYLRVSREEQINNESATTYPPYDGVSIKCYTWSTLENSQIQPWQGTYASGDNGRNDLNVITEPMYPNKSLFDSQNLGPQIAKKDSLNLTRTVSIPNTPDIPILSNITIPYNNMSYPLPVCSVRYSNSIGNEQTQITGEW